MLRLHNFKTLIPLIFLLNLVTCCRHHLFKTLLLLINAINRHHNLKIFLVDAQTFADTYNFKVLSII